MARGGARPRRVRRRPSRRSWSAVGERRAPAAARRFGDAVRAFERERYADVTRLLKPLADQAPGVAAVRELLGIAFYRQGKWSDAARHLEVYRTIKRAYDVHPVLADSYRALGQWDEVAGLWEDLRTASPGARSSRGQDRGRGRAGGSGRGAVGDPSAEEGGGARSSEVVPPAAVVFAGRSVRAGGRGAAGKGVLFPRPRRDSSFADVVERLEALE